MKKFFILCVFLASIISHAQIIPISLEDRLNLAPVIVEGKILNQKSYRSEQTIFTDYELQIFNRFKGNVEESKINLTLPGGKVDSQILLVCPNSNIQIDDFGIFLLKKSGDKFVPAFPGQSEQLYEESLSFSKKNLAIQEYINLIKQKNDSNKMAAPQITISSISPTVVSAGRGEVLTITGTGFGTTGPSSAVRVYVPNISTPGQNSSLTSPIHYISWSDTEIKLKLPSYATSGTLLVGSSASYQTTPPIVVKYAVRDQITGNGASILPVKMVSLSNGGIVFKKNANLNNTDAVNTFKKALDDWTCKTNIKWSFDESTTSTNTNATDGNSVFFAADLGASTLGLTYTTLSICSLTGRSYVSDVDIAINSSKNINYTLNNTAANQYDFYTIILHELGHARNLDHVVLSSDLMYRSLAAGVMNRNIGPEPTEGGIWVQADSTTNPICSQSVMQNAVCAAMNTIDHHAHNEISIFPNPTTGTLYINTEDNILQTEIYDASGRVISKNFTDQSDIDVTELSSGAYTIKITTQNQVIHKKFLKK